MKSCDIDGVRDCEYWCGEEEPEEEYYDDWDEYDLEIGFDPYMGCYSEDC